MYYCNGDVRFDTLSDQKKWWNTIKNKIDNEPYNRKFKYFQFKNNKYQQHHHIDFDVYEPGTPIPVFMSEKQQCPIIPSACYPRTKESPKTLKCNQPLKTNTQLPHFTRSQLENALIITFPGANIDSFRQLSDNSIAFQRKSCLMGLLNGLDGHKCREPEAIITFNTVFDKNTNKNAVCELLYSCNCSPNERPYNFI